MQKAEKRLSFIVSLFYYALIGVCAYLLLGYALPLLLPFIAAVAIAAAARVPSELLSRRFTHIPRPVISAAVITVILAAVIAPLAILTCRIAAEVADFVSGLPDMLENALTALDGRLPAWLERILEGVNSRMHGSISDLLMDAISNLPGSGISAIGSAAMRVPSFVISVLITIAASYFIGLDPAGAKRTLRSLCSHSEYERLARICRCLRSTILKLLRTYALLMMLTFAELASGFAIINFFGADVENILPLSILIALVDILPVLGVGTVLIPWAAVEMLSGGMAKGLMLLIIYAIIIIVRNFLEPKLVGSSFGLHPALMLAAIYVGGKLFGFIGIFALPVVVITASEMRKCSGSA